MSKILRFRLFENKDQFYHKIDSIPEEGYDCWTEREIDRIKRWFGSNMESVQFTIPSGRICCIGIHGGEWSLNVYKIRDDWWVVRYNDWSVDQPGSTWKCDQFDGMVELMSDIFNPKYS